MSVPKYIPKPLLYIVLLLLTTTTLSSCTSDNPGYFYTVGDTPVQIVDGNGNIVNIDEHSTLVTISQEHYRVHEGTMFTISRNGNIGNSDLRDTLIRTGNKEYHFAFKIESEAEGSYIFYENATTSNNGTAETIYNRNRTSNNTSTMAISYNAVVSANGTNLITEHWGASKSTGGEERSEKEWILRPNTIYLLREINQTTSDNYFSTVLRWYELEH